MFKRTALAVGAIAAAAALVLSGCSTSSSGSSDAQPKTLTYWATNQGTSIDNDTQILTPVLKKFTAQTGIKVNLEVISWNDLMNRLQNAITSGQGPDVSGIGNTWASSLQATGAFLPFGDSELKAVGGRSKFVSTALKTGGAPGKTITSVPFLGYAYGLYCNKAMFASAGLTPPTTWEEMVSDAQKLTDATKGTYGYGLVGGRYDINSQFAFMLGAQNGAAPFDSAGKPTFSKAGFVSGIKRYVDLMQTDKVVDPADAQYNVNASQVVDDFAKGKVAMVANQNNADAAIQQAGMSSDAYGVVPLPAPAGGKKIASMVAGINMSIFKNTKNKTGALKLVKYMTSPSVQKTLDKQYAALPVLNGATPNFTDNADEAATFQKIYSTMSKPLPLVSSESSYESSVGKAMNNFFSKVATGGTVSESDIESAMKTAEQQVAANG